VIPRHGLGKLGDDRICTFLQRLLRRGDVEFASRIGNMGDLRIGEVVLCEKLALPGQMPRLLKSLGF
jgi:hypothetical protein